MIINNAIYFFKTSNGNEAVLYELIQISFYPVLLLTLMKNFYIPNLVFSILEQFSLRCFNNAYNFTYLKLQLIAHFSASTHLVTLSQN